MARQYATASASRTAAAAADPFAQHTQLVSSILCPPFHTHQGSPAKHAVAVAAVQQPPPHHVQIHQPQILATSQGQQQYVPVSVVEPGGRQMLLTVSV